ncbi:sterile alpha motif domain containing 1a isoform X2 [Limanda limanda]|uniref:sterile alpha motif domain containing 1a isoform X2 n=1 Tax=Limanda limanda TaxID=27771 RepID=UPI0029C7C640|nr:sterile alpha motif domain containing 1a isoform X2 [Limanda limanda]
MSESQYREWILDTIDSLRSRKARPDLERICRMVRRRHGFESERTCAELEALIREQTVLKVNYKGSVSYRNAAKVQRRSRRKDDGTAGTAGTAAGGGRRSSAAAAAEDASLSDLSNGDSALGPADQDPDQDPDPDEEEDLEADTSLAMDTDSNAEEEGGADDSQDGQGRPPPPGRTHEDAAVHCSAVRAFSAPCSPSGARPGPGLGSGPGSAPDSLSLQKAGERPSSLPPPSPRALPHNDWACDSAVCPAERQHPGMQRDKAALKPAVPSVTTCALKNNVKKEDGGKVEDSSPLSDQLVPDYAARLDESRNVSDGRPQTLSLPSDNCTFKKKIDISLFAATEDGLLNGGKGEEISVKKEKMSQNLLQWTVTDVATYFSSAGFPEQALAFRTQEIDGKSLLLMQRSDVLTGLSIRLGPALKIYERHVKVLQRTHFLEFEDL